MRLRITPLVVASLLLALPLHEAIGEEWVTVKSWSGSGIKNTEPFEIKSSAWKVIWKVSNVNQYGALLQIYVQDRFNEMVTIVGNSDSSGESYVYSLPGTYHLEINSGNLDWEIIVEEPRTAKPSEPTTTTTEKLSLSNLQMVDAIGSRVSDLSVGQQVVLQSSVKNNLGIDQKFAYIMHIKDSDGITIMIAWINGEIPSSKTFDIGLSWIPDVKGNYDVSVFVWQSVANPLPLSSKTLSATISVT